MSIEYWPIVLYGVRCDDLKVKKEYCDEENIGQDDVWDFLCSFRDLFGSFGLVFYHSGAEEKIYIGIPPKYTWNDSNLYEYKTESDADKVILNFILKCFDIEISEEEFMKQISYIETCGFE